MNKTVKNIVLTIVLVACGTSGLIDAFRGGGGGGRGGMRGGGMRGGGAMRGSHGGMRGSGMKHAGNMKRGSGMGHNKRLAHGRGRGGQGKFAHHRQPGRYWHHHYPYNYNRYPWGLWIAATVPFWWTAFNWNSYYASNPALQDQIDSLRAQLNANVEEMRQKDKRLADLESRLEDADGDEVERLQDKISSLKSALRKQARETKKLEAQLKKTANISDSEISGAMGEEEAV